MSKQLFSLLVSRVQVFTGFSGHGNSIYNIIPLLKKENVHPIQFGINHFLASSLNSQTVLFDP